MYLLNYSLHPTVTPDSLKLTTYQHYSSPSQSIDVCFSTCNWVSAALQTLLDSHKRDTRLSGRG